ncbi:MAG: hypothetical protein M0C28_01440 [Candidatus Moduliflexus flocculans]|nr:hypothetical protein [Candidatus Moduliflexus flocculans]
MSLPKGSDPFGNPQIDPVPREKVPQFYADFWMTPNAVNHGQTVNGYWMEQSRGRFGITEVEVFGPYRMPKPIWALRAQRAPPERPDARRQPGRRAAWSATATRSGRADVGRDVRKDFDAVLRIYASYDETGVWQEFGEMKFASKDDIPPAVGQSRPRTSRAGSRRATSSGRAGWPARSSGACPRCARARTPAPSPTSSGTSPSACPTSTTIPTSGRTAGSAAGTWDMMDRGCFNGPGGPHRRWVVPPAQGAFDAGRPDGPQPPRERLHRCIGASDRGAGGPGRERHRRGRGHGPGRRSAARHLRRPRRPVRRRKARGPHPARRSGRRIPSRPERPTTPSTRSRSSSASATIPSPRTTASSSPRTRTACAAGTAGRTSSTATSGSSTPIPRTSASSTTSSRTARRSCGRSPTTASSTTPSSTPVSGRAACANGRTRPTGSTSMSSTSEKSEDGILVYTLAVRSLDGAGRQARGVSLAPPTERRAVKIEKCEHAAAVRPDQRRRLPRGGCAAGFRRRHLSSLGVRRRRGLERAFTEWFRGREARRVRAGEGVRIAQRRRFAVGDGHAARDVRVRSGEDRDGDREARRAEYLFHSAIFSWNRARCVC